MSVGCSVEKLYKIHVDSISNLNLENNSLNNITNKLNTRRLKSVIRENRSEESSEVMKSLTQIQAQLLCSLQRGKHDFVTYIAYRPDHETSSM